MGIMQGLFRICIEIIWRVRRDYEGSIQGQWKGSWKA